MSELPVRPIEADVDLKVFWDATGEHRLLIPHCEACDEAIWYPRPYCPGCGRVGVRWVEASGRGTIYSFTITRNGSGSWRAVAPYVLAFVDLEEGPRVLTNIVDTDPEALRIGQQVRLAWDDTGAGQAVFRFTPDPPTS